MENERKLRLIQVEKEFKVGLNTISDFLRKKGVAIDGSPNTQISSDAYALIEREFGSNRTSTSARDSVREKISSKQATVSIEEPKPQPAPAEPKVEPAPQPVVVEPKREEPKPVVAEPAEEPPRLVCYKEFKSKNSHWKSRIWQGWDRVCRVSMPSVDTSPPSFLSVLANWEAL